MAMEKLGWAGSVHNLKDDLGWYFQGYKARGGDAKKMDLGKVRRGNVRLGYAFSCNLS
jgi:hypothetical protein